MRSSSLKNVLQFILFDTKPSWLKISYQAFMGKNCILHTRVTQDLCLTRLVCPCTPTLKWVLFTHCPCMHKPRRSLSSLRLSGVSNAKRGWRTLSAHVSLASLTPGFILSQGPCERQGRSMEVPRATVTLYIILSS